MDVELTREPAAVTKVPWNKGKMIGSKPPLRIKNVWSIRTKLQVDGRLRDLAMFNLAIDSKLRGCDVVTLRVEDIAPHGAALDRPTVRQRKTGHPVRPGSSRPGSPGLACQLLRHPLAEADDGHPHLPANRQPHALAIAEQVDV